MKIKADIIIMQAWSHAFVIALLDILYIDFIFASILIITYCRDLPVATYLLLRNEYFSFP